MGKNDVDKKRFTRKARDSVAGLLVTLIILGSVVFSMYKWFPDQIPDKSGWLWLLVVFAYVLGVVVRGFSVVRFAFLTHWRFHFLRCLSLLPIVVLALLLCQWIIFHPEMFKVSQAIANKPELFVYIILLLMLAVLVGISIVKFEPAIRSRLAQARTIEAFGVRFDFTTDEAGEKGPVTLAVTSFRDLMKVISQLIREAKENDTIRFTAYTPALGYLTQTKQEWEELHYLMTLKMHKISMTCLAKEALEKWHDRFEGKVTKRGKITTVLIKEATYVSEELLKYTNHKARKVFDELPEYYLFASKDRAIVVVPFNVPKLEEERTTEAPSMVGFVTNESRIVELVKSAHDTFHRAGPVT